MVRSRLACGDQLIAHAAWEGNVSDPVAVQVPELAAPETELNSAKAMGSNLDARPGRHDSSEPLGHSALLIGYQLVVDCHTADARPAAVR